ncbi:MAG: hypothetical protein RBU37_25475, partial [Myxococcota bacterium]|nr:hypothetical protein [Myxococcota bacterium]
MSSATNTTQPAWVLYSSVLWVVLLSACASAPRWDWAERETLEMIAGNDAEAPAEILLWKSSIYTSSLYSDWLTRISEHRVYRVLQEDGLRYADQIVEFRPHGELVQFQARSISPSGEVRELSMDDLRHTESHIGFQFPLVELGSVLEFITVYEYDGWLFHQYGDTLPSDIPIRRL